MRKLAVYGTLKEGHYNYDRFKQLYPDIKVLEETTISGYEMYNFGGWYPVVIKGEGDIVVQVLEVPDEAYTKICAMEKGAGYSYEIIKVNNHICVIFLFDLAMRGYARVLNGNWDFNQYQK